MKLIDDISEGSESRTVPVVCDSGDVAIPSPWYKYSRFYVGGPDVDLVPTIMDRDGCICTLSPSRGCARGNRTPCPCFGPQDLLIAHTAADASDSEPPQFTPTDVTDSPHFECSVNCPCGVSCGNRMTQRGVSVDVEVFHTREKGWGLRTTQAIPAGTYCMSYVGEMDVVVHPTASVQQILTEHDATARHHANDGAGISNYLLVLREHAGEKVYRTHIDAMYTSNCARFINHSCAPNMDIHIVRAHSVVPEAALVANRNISCGEELTFSYGAAATTASHSGKQCFCGAVNCRGVMPFDIAA